MHLWAQVFSHKSTGIESFGPPSYIRSVSLTPILQFHPGALGSPVMVNPSMDSSVPEEPLPQNSLGKIAVIVVRDTQIFKVHGLTLEPTAGMTRSDDISIPN